MDIGQIEIYTFVEELMIKKMGKVEKFLFILALVLLIIWIISNNYIFSLGYGLALCGFFFSRSLEYLKIKEKIGGYGYIGLAIILLLYIILSKTFDLSIFTLIFISGNGFTTGALAYKKNNKSTALANFFVGLFGLIVLIIILMT